LRILLLVVVVACKVSAYVMSLLGDRSASFIIRIWWELNEDEGSVPDWRGSIECVRTGEKAYFRELAVIDGFLKSHMPRTGTEVDELAAESTNGPLRPERRSAPRNKGRTVRRRRLP